MAEHMMVHALGAGQLPVDRGVGIVLRVVELLTITLEQGVAGVEQVQLARERDRSCPKRLASALGSPAEVAALDSYETDDGAPLVLRSKPPGGLFEIIEKQQPA